MNVLLRGLIVVVLQAVVVLSPAIAQNFLAQPPLLLQRAVAIAQQQDPWLTGSQYKEQAIQAQSIAKGTLPDPVMSLGFANLPVDDFDFNTDNMTQFKVGVSQVFPRGDSRAIERQQLAAMGAQQPYMRDDRRARVAVTVTELWLEHYRSAEAIRLIEQDRSLFEHLVDVAQSSYTSGIGKSRQQDLVRAQLELTRLEDRLTVLQLSQNVAHSQLSEWLVGDIAAIFKLDDQFPTLNLAVDIDVKRGASPPLLALLLAHPKIKSLDQKIVASSSNVQIAKQKYQPQWGLNASYGYRDDDPFGNDRSDFFSVGVSFDMPLFTGNRQDKQVQSAFSEVEVIKTEKTLALRTMRANLQTGLVRLQQLQQREVLYQDRLLKEIHDQAESSLSAYTHDRGDFSEVVRARIAELNAKIDFLNIRVDRLKTIAQINYFLPADNNAALLTGVNL